MSYNFSCFCLLDLNISVYFEVGTIFYNCLNLQEQLRAKLEKLKKELPWLETLDVDVEEGTLEDGKIENDFERELNLLDFLFWQKILPFLQFQCKTLLFKLQASGTSCKSCCTSPVRDGCQGFSTCGLLCGDGQR